MELRTVRLTLREYRVDNFEAMFALDTDPAVQQMRGRAALTREQSRRYFDGVLRAQHEQPRGHFGLIIEDRSEQVVLGRCRLQITNENLQEAEIAYHLSPSNWGQGYATETARELLRFGFQDLDLHRITAKCYVENSSSIHVLEKIGMQLEGRMRQNRWVNGVRKDTLVYSILSHEWQASSS